MYYKIIDLKRKIEEMKQEEYGRSDRQNLLKLRREKDEFSEEIIGLKKEIDFLNCQLNVSYTHTYIDNQFIDETNLGYFFRKQESL